MLRRRRPDLHQLGPRAFWSASEHLIVEAPVAPELKRRRFRQAGSVGVLLVCVAVIAYFLTNSPSLTVMGAAARSPELWVKHYAAVQHQPLRLQTLVEYDEGTVADLTIADGDDRQRITLRKQHGSWREVG